MKQCICCLKETACIVILTCSHLFCKQCFEAVKLEESVFCMECCRMSKVKPVQGMVEQESRTEDNEDWEKATAMKFSAMSLNTDRSDKADSSSTSAIPSTGGCINIHGVSQATLLVKSILPKYGTHRPPPDYFWCTVAESVTPQRIGVQVIDEELKKFLIMDEKLQRLCRSSSRSQKIMADLLKIGENYSISRRGKWYRAMILRDTRWIGVSLLDVGEIYWVHFNNYLTVHPLEPEFKELPAQAVHCVVNDEPHCYHKNDKACEGRNSECWDFKCRAFVREIKNSKALCLVDPRPGASLRIMMYINNEEISVNQQIIEKGWSRRKMDEEHARLFKMSDALRKDILATVPAEVSLKKTQKPQWTVTPPSEALPQKFKGLVTWVDDSGKMYIHTTEWTNRLVYIRDRLKEFFSASMGTVHHGFLEIGDCCFVKYKNNWFRAILEELSEYEATVFMVDFGVAQKVSHKAIRVKDIFFKIPIQTYRCALEGIYPIDEQGSRTGHLTESAVNLLHDLTVNNEFHVKIESPKPLRVSLRCIDNNVNVADILVAAKKAKYR